MVLSKIIIRNFRSFSNKPVEIGLKGFNIFVGDNGSGKTSILLGIRYALFGTVGLDIRNIDLVNKINQDGMSVKLFCKNGENEIIIERGIEKKQSYVNLYIDGKELDLPSIKDYDKKIVELLGFDYKMFYFFSINSKIFS